MQLALADHYEMTRATHSGNHNYTAPKRFRLVVSIVTYHSDITDVCRTIDSLEGQCDSCYIMVIDNGSDALYQERLQQYMPPYVDLVLLSNNRGFGYGHNQAMFRAPASDYQLVLNPDVVLHEGAIDKLIQFLEHTPQAGLVVPKVFYPDGSLQALNKRNPTVLDLALRLFTPPALARIAFVRNRLDRYSMMDKGYEQPYSLPFASGCCMLFRRSVLMRLGGFDEGFFLYFEDADITRRVNEISSAWFCPDAHITHIWQRGSRRSLKLLRIMLQSAARYFAKWGLKLW